MSRQPHIYGIDIETDTRYGGLDPMVAPVSTVALSGRMFEELFIGDEAELLQALDRRLAILPPGLLATWNGGTFDLPFIADRARLLGVDLDLHLCPERALTLGRPALPGHGGAYRGAWGPHTHLDAYRLYDDGSSATRGSLRGIARLLGIGASGGTHPAHPDLATEVLHAHAASDARLARVLAERRWQAAVRLADRLEPGEARPVEVAAQRLVRRSTAPSRPVPASSLPGTTAPAVTLHPAGL